MLAICIAVLIVSGLHVCVLPSGVPAISAAVSVASSDGSVKLHDTLVLSYAVESGQGQKKKAVEKKRPEIPSIKHAAERAPVSPHILHRIASQHALLSGLHTHRTRSRVEQ
jgi:hypothetical protein